MLKYIAVAAVAALAAAPFAHACSGYKWTCHASCMIHRAPEPAVAVVSPDVNGPTMAVVVEGKYDCYPLATPVAYKWKVSNRCSDTSCALHYIQR